MIEGTNYGQEPQADLGQGLEASAEEFGRNVKEAADRLTQAAEQFLTITGRLTAAAEQVQEASRRAQEAQKAAEAVQDRLERNHSDIGALMRDLQERIAALAVLARPLPADQSSEQEVQPAPEPVVEAAQPQAAQSPWSSWHS